MQDLISRQASLDAISTFGNREYRRKQGTLRDAYKLISALPSEPVGNPERLKGKWIESETYGFICSECGSGYKGQPTIMGKPIFEFCPICGADMRRKNDEF